MSTVRWIFTEVATDDTYTVEINPNQMGFPLRGRNLRAVAYHERATGADTYKSLASPAPAKEWSFGGPIRTQQHHDDLVEWSRKEGLIHVTDHLERTFAVVFSGFLPTDRTPTPNVPWRLTYTMNALVLRQVS